MRIYRPEAELYEIAENVSNFITIRSYDDGCSEDVTRWATEQEKTVLYNIVYSALMSLNWGEKCRSNKDMEQAILDCAEFTTISFLPECNTYMSVYIPLRKVLEEWEQI